LLLERQFSYFALFVTECVLVGVNGGVESATFGRQSDVVTEAGDA
jgi:hypothetical protein